MKLSFKVNYYSYFKSDVKGEYWQKRELIKVIKRYNFFNLDLVVVLARFTFYTFGQLGSQHMTRLT